MGNQLNWGIVGTGKMAHKFAHDMQLDERSKLLAVASRSSEKAEIFRQAYRIELAFSSYRDLFQDERIDIVYIATPHTSHASLSIEAMKAGKHVLCEKPSAMSKEELAPVIQKSRECGLFYMEAMWSRFNTAIRQVLDSELRQQLGEIKYINADFCFRANYDPSSRLFDPNLGGGSLLDIGIYPAFLAYSLLGMPEQIMSSRNERVAGVDTQSAFVFRYPDAHALLFSSFDVNSRMEARIYGRDASVFIKHRWHESAEIEINYGDTSEIRAYVPVGNGYYNEIVHCRECIAEKKLESDLWSHQRSLDLIEILDRIRFSAE